MIKPNKVLLKEIADSIDAGCNVFFNIKTGEVKNILDFDQFYDADMEPWQEDIDEIEANYEDYIKIEPLDSSKNFRIMEEFADQVTDKKLQKQLYTALSKKGPFHNFKWEVDNSGPYRQQWFDFKMNWLMEYVDEYIQKEYKYRNLFTKDV